METPSSTTRITRSQASVFPNNKITNTIPVSRKIEDSEKILSKSKGQQQDRSALMDVTNDSPIVGLANGGNVETPSAQMRGSKVKNTPGSGEALLRGQVKTLLQKVEEEAMEILDPTPQMQNLFGNGTDGLASVTPSVVLQQQQQSVSQMENEVFDGKCEITKSLLMDFSAKSQVSDASKECTSELSYQEVTQGSGVGSNSIDDDASVWSMQVNTSTNDEDDEEEEIAEEDEEDYYEDFEEEEEEYEEDLLLDELCEGLNNIKVNEKVVPKFAGKHTRFVYNSDDELVKEEEDEENSIESVTADSTNILRLKGLPTPEGKHLRFSQEEEGESPL